MKKLRKVKADISEEQFQKLLSRDILFFRVIAFTAFASDDDKPGARRKVFKCIAYNKGYIYEYHTTHDLTQRNNKRCIVSTTLKVKIFSLKQVYNILYYAHTDRASSTIFELKNFIFC